MTELMKQTVKSLVFMVLALGFTAFTVKYHRVLLGNAQSAPTVIQSTGPTVTQLERIGELLTTRVHVTDVLTAEGEGYRISFLVKADALLACDMTKAKIVNLNPEKRTATIRLSQPRVICARVDHSKTKAWSVEKTSWLPWWGDQGIVRDTAMFHAQKLVEAAAGSERHLAPAKAQTEQLICQMYDFVGWKVTVEWQ